MNVPHIKAFLTNVINSVWHRLKNCNNISCIRWIILRILIILEWFIHSMCLNVRLQKQEIFVFTQCLVLWTVQKKASAWFSWKTMHNIFVRWLPLCTSHSRQPSYQCLVPLNTDQTPLKYCRERIWKGRCSTCFQAEMLKVQTVSRRANAIAIDICKKYLPSNVNEHFTNSGQTCATRA